MFAQGYREKGSFSELHIRTAAGSAVTAGSSGFVEAMEEYLRAAVSEVPGEDIQGSRSAVAA